VSNAPVRPVTVEPPKTTMTTTTQTPPRLGRCPNCRTEIASYDVRIHETPGRPPAVLAECPNCRLPVNPE